MEQITLLGANNPKKIQEAVNELLEFKNQDFSWLTKETVGLGNVDNTTDANKPVSVPQKEYIDQQDALNVKKTSAKMQIIDSDLCLGESKSLSVERGDDAVVRILAVENMNGFENIEVGADDIPIRLHHSTRDINATIVSRNPKVNVKDEQGATVEENIAFISDLQSSAQSLKSDMNESVSNTRGELLDIIEAETNRAKTVEADKVDKGVMSEAEIEDGIVTSVTGDFYTDVSTDSMNLHITTRSIIDGSVLAETITPLKLASDISRGLMSSEQVRTLSDLLSRVVSIEGKTSRYIYTVSTNPTATEIDAFVQNQGKVAPYEGVAVVVAVTYHIWHYYENDGIGWRDDGADTVNQATNTSYGIVIGSNEVGKIFVETDGSMSVVGFDILTNRVTSIENSRLNDVSIAGGTSNGTIKLTKSTNGSSVTTDNIPVTGLGNAAFTNSSAYATAAQGGKADTAYQKPAVGIPNSDLSDVARSSLLRADNSVQTIKANGVELTKTNGVVDIVIVAVSQSEMESYVTDAIEAAINEAIGGSY